MAVTAGVILVLSAIVAGVASGQRLVARGPTGDSVGPLPSIDSIPQSRCGALHVSSHIVTVGEKLTAAAGPPVPQACGGPPGSVSWIWSEDFAGMKMIKRCGMTSASCTFKAIAPSGPPGARYFDGCINGDSRQGSWTSCDYFAVLPKCHGRPALALSHRRVSGATLISFKGSGWDVRSCGPVTLSASIEQGSQPIASYNSRSFRGRIKIRGRRICGLDLYARQAPNTLLKASFSLGKPANAWVVFARPGVTRDGEPIRPGDLLCQHDVPTNVYSDLAANRVTAADVRAIAAALGQQLIEIQGYGKSTGAWSYTADASGQVGVWGNTVESAQPDLVNALALHIVEGGPTSLNTSSPDPSPVLGGFARAQGSYTVQGDLKLDGALLLIEGDLNVSGRITGTGAVIVTGNISAGGASLTGDPNALIAGGHINLP
jgi:hypothetical protein